MFVIPSIFTAIQRVKTGMFYKINCVIFMLMAVHLLCHGHKTNKLQEPCFLSKTNKQIESVPGPCKQVFI